MRARSVLMAAPIALTLAAAACGGGASGTPPTAGTRVVMTEFRFTPNNLTAKAGQTNFFLVNSGTVAHDMVILGPNGSRLTGSDLVQPGNASQFTAGGLAPGTYRFSCDQPGHAAQGMTGTLTVT